MGQFNVFGLEIDEVNPNDEVYTPEHIAKEIVDLFNPTGIILEPAKGKGVFLKFLSKNTEWCEIREGKDFFNYTKKVDWIITNPPYSVYDAFLEHSFEIADNIVFLVPFNKVFNSFDRINKIYSYGGIKTIWLIGTGNKAGFPFGFPCGAFYFKKGYRGNIEILFREELKLKTTDDLKKGVL